MTYVIMGHAGTSRKYLRGPRGVGFLYVSHAAMMTSSTTAMQGWQPATLDNHGAEWVSQDKYELREGAVRYQQYEINFAAKVRVQQLNSLGGCIV